MIHFTTGDLLQSDAQALVNAVNCVGVMGKGIAYQFKKAYPAMAKDYTARCKRGEVRLGRVYAVNEGSRLIVNFPTKGHWRSKSRLTDVQAGLSSLRQLIIDGSIGSIALPPLGCGNGGLDWSAVRALIEQELGDLDIAQVTVYEPVVKSELQGTIPPKLAIEEYVLGGLRSRMVRPSRMNIQWAAYFFGSFSGEGLFCFEDYRQGPWCVSLEAMFVRIREYLEIMKMAPAQLVQDGIQRGLAGTAGDRLANLLPAIQLAADYANMNPTDLALLSSTHAVVSRRGPARPDELMAALMEWSPDGRTKFDVCDIERALRLLCDHALIEPDLLGWTAAAVAPTELPSPQQDASSGFSDDQLRVLDRYCARHLCGTSRAIGLALASLPTASAD